MRHVTSNLQAHLSIHGKNTFNMTFNSKQITIGKVFSEVDTANACTAQHTHKHRTTLFSTQLLGVVPFIPTTQLAYRSPLLCCVKIVSFPYTVCDILQRFRSKVSLHFEQRHSPYTMHKYACSL